MAITMDNRQARVPGPMPATAVARIAQRARAFASARRHSGLVRLLRVVCPLVAVCTLVVYAGVVFVNWQLSRSKFKLDGFVITADDLTMKNPSYFDVTKDGRYEVRAQRAIVSFGQKKDTPVKLIEVRGEMVQNSGTVTKLKAKNGLLDNAKGELELYDGIEIDGSNGLMARLTRAKFYTKENKVVSDDPVSATMPTGSVQAASMTLNTKTKLAQFRGHVVVRLVPQQGQTIAAGKDARLPVDIRSEELDVDDTAKTAQFRGQVVAVQGETILQAPYLMVKYEGKASAALGAETPAGRETAAAGEPPSAAETTKAADKDGGSAHVTYLWARNGVEITAGNDRRITGDRVDFDVVADSALFAGNVVAVQDKNVLKGGELAVDRKAGRTFLQTPGGGRITATFLPPASTTAPPRAAKRQPAAQSAQPAMMGSFKADRNVPMNVEADTLEVIDGSSKAVFEGNVRARQGDLLLRTSELAAFYSGKAGLGMTGDTAAVNPKAKGKDKDKAEIVRLEARHSVIMTSKDQSATAERADFDVKANTALLSGNVVVDSLVQGSDDPLKRNIVSGDRLRIDLTTGVYQFESDPAQAAKANALIAKTPAISASPPAVGPASLQEKMKGGCQPGRQCALFFPQQPKKKAEDAVRKKAADVP
jgi:LPS export ABC transporter protein LptC/lipopolysaccharide transport protein LptA